MPEDRLVRLTEIVSAVARQLLSDRAASQLAILDDGSPEVELAVALLRPVGEERLVRVVASEQQVESVLHVLGDRSMPSERAAAEARRLLARLVRDAIPTCTANKTALLLGGELPPEPFLPLGDLYASEVQALCGGWSGPPAIRTMAAAAGGIERLDEVLRARFDARDPAALDGLPQSVRTEIAEALAAGTPGRMYPHLIPKLGARTLGVDLFE